MIAAAHVIPRDGIDLERAGSRGGIAYAALKTVDALDEPADLVLIAVPAGRGEEARALMVNINLAAGG